MAKYSKKSGEMVERALKKKKKGTLRTGTGKKVTSRKQAIAIGLSEAREKGAKVPGKKKKSTSKQRPAAKRSSSSRKKTSGKSKSS
jgi:hypothetical protein